MSKTPWVVAAAVAVALAGAMFVTRPANGSIHPTPGALDAYAAARRAAPTLDGVYCHCDCSKHAGHRSLLTCFESDHGAFCDICMGEAMLASGMAARGQSLMDIRAAIDRQFGS